MSRREASSCARGRKFEKSGSHKRRRNHARTMREREWASDAVGDRQGQWRAASRAPPLFNAAKVRSSLPLVAHCARSTMDGVERRGRGSLERWIGIRGVGTMVGEQPFESAHSVFTVFPHFNSARFGKKFIKRSAAGEAHRSTRIPPPPLSWMERKENNRVSLFTCFFGRATVYKVFLCFAFALR